MKLFITAIGTDSGKTLVSAIFTEALQADYCKPIQAGFPRDTETVMSLVSNSKSAFFSETYLLGSPMSPHAAARIDGVHIEPWLIQLPQSENPHLVMEGAGGMLVPLNDEDFVIDLPARLGLPVVLVANLYLGSINHTLLSVNELKRRNMDVLGIIFNGHANPESERIILHHSGYRCLLRIPQLPVVDRRVVRQYAALLREQFVQEGLLHS